MELKDWIPFFQELVWPAVVSCILFMFRKRVGDLVNVMEKRICDGAPVTFPGGVSVGAVPANQATEDPSDATLKLDLLNVAPTDAESVGTTQMILAGVFLEVRLNEEIADSMLGDLERLSRGKGLIPLRRLNEKAAAGFLQHPPVPLNDPMINLCWVYLQEIKMFNRLVDTIDNPIVPRDYLTGRIYQALGFRDRLKGSGSALLKATEARLQRDRRSE